MAPVQSVPNEYTLADELLAALLEEAADELEVEPACERAMRKLRAITVAKVLIYCFILNIEILMKFLN